ncbi:5284_t:CDS:1, partial [Gigaspora rosea]
DTQFKQCYIVNETLRINLNIKISPDPPILEQNFTINTSGNATRNFENSTIFVSLVMFDIPYCNYSRAFIPSTEIDGQFNTTNTAGPLPQGFNYNVLYIQVRIYEKDEAQPP